MSIIKTGSYFCDMCKMMNKNKIMYADVTEESLLRRTHIEKMLALNYRSIRSSMKLQLRPVSMIHACRI